MTDAQRCGDCGAPAGAKAVDMDVYKAALAAASMLAMHVAGCHLAIDRGTADDVAREHVATFGPVVDRYHDAVQKAGRPSP